MPVRLVDAMRETLSGWQADVAPAWQPVLADVALGFDAIDPDLDMDYWEPIFPVRRGRTFPGAPQGAHMLRAFDGVEPDAVRCVILGQDPYPAPDFSTGRAFEAGNVATWRELDKMFSKSVRAFIQQVCEARTGDPAYARSFDDWPQTLGDIENGTIGFEAPSELADCWVAQGVLLLNSSLTLSRFKVEVDDHQSRGHLPLWRPLIQKVLAHIAARKHPVVFIGFGDAAIDNLRLAGVAQPDAPMAAVLRDHPARADAVLALENPFLICNRHLEAMGARPIAW